MKTSTAGGVLAAMADFVTTASPPALARERALTAFIDTIGVTLAGAPEAASRAVQHVIGANGGHACTVLGTPLRANPTDAALANGTAAHALDYDDMCFVSLAHPSAPLVGSLLSAGELVGASGAALVDAYVVGFEIEARLGRVMNPRHYQRGWHCTSTLGAIGSAAAVSHLLELDANTIGHALAIAASEASGLKENFGTMVKPLHAGLAARDGVLAALLARSGLTASERAFDGAQGFLRAMDSERHDLETEASDLGARWELVDTGITVKLYPSCAATHPPLDALLALRQRERFTDDTVEHVEIDVDAVTPTVLIHPRPTTGLEAKFSLQYCAAAAVVDGRVDVETFEAERLADPRISAMLARVSMHADETLGTGRPPLTEARVRVRLRDGRTLVEAAHGARGYPVHPATEAELDDKFLSCAKRSLPDGAAHEALALVRRFHDLDDVRALTRVCRSVIARA